MRAHLRDSRSPACPPHRRGDRSCRDRPERCPGPQDTSRRSLVGRPRCRYEAIASPTSAGRGSRSSRPRLPCTTNSPVRQSMSSSLRPATSLARIPSRSRMRIIAWSRRPSVERRSQHLSNSRASAFVIPRGTDERRRPVTASAACDRSTSANPSMKQKRRNDRSPATKNCVALTDTAADSRITAPVTCAAVNPASPLTGESPTTNRCACLTYPRTVPAARPRSASRKRSKAANRTSVGESATAGPSTATTPSPRSTSSRNSRPGRDQEAR